MPHWYTALELLLQLASLLVRSSQTSINALPDYCTYDRPLMATEHGCEELLGRRIDATPSLVPAKDAVLRGKHVTLDSFNKEHIPSLWRNLDLLNNPQLFDYMPISRPTSPESAWDLFSSYCEAPGCILYSVHGDPEMLNRPAIGNAIPVHEEVIGVIGFLDIRPEYRTIEVGAVIFGPALQRTVAATEVHYLLLRLALEGGISDDKTTGQVIDPPYRRVTWRCNSLNLKSRRAAERLGYVYEGTMRNHLIANGRSRDSDILSIIDTDWPIVQRGFEKWLDVDNFDGRGQQRSRLTETRASAV